MNLREINTSEHISKLVDIAQQYDFPLENIEAVPNIMDWCETRDIEENNPFRTGKCLRNSETGEYLILLAQEITADMQNSVIGALELRGFSSNTEVLHKPLAFLMHLLLHEVAHAIDYKWSEEECDSWAFKELEKIEI
ncbi:MAG: hypothetical protein KZQ97_13225 [Candidatus Thiodiazotropha sp. (ex Dulcina madagascariensis)]|nr:hypothetical protein [Candidatus Thiodiazotropha sp. (ex Dulcina madagascariensis)]